MKHIKLYEEFINEKYKDSLTFKDVFDAAKKVHGQKLKGTAVAGFTIPYEYGTIDVWPDLPDRKRAVITWESGGTTQDTDTYEFETAIRIVQDKES